MSWCGEGREGGGVREGGRKRQREREGGRDRDRNYLLDPLLTSPARIKDHPGKRWRLASAVVGSSMYVFGGYRLWHGFRAGNSQTNRWANVVDVCTPKNWATCTAEHRGGYLDDLWKFRVSDSNWERIQAVSETIPNEYDRYYYDSRSATMNRTVWPSGRAGHTLTWVFVCRVCSRKGTQLSRRISTPNAVSSRKSVTASACSHQTAPTDRGPHRPSASSRERGTAMDAAASLVGARDHVLPILTARRLAESGGCCWWCSIDGWMDRSLPPDRSLSLVHSLALSTSLDLSRSRPRSRSRSRPLLLTHTHTQHTHNTHTLPAPRPQQEMQ